MLKAPTRRSATMSCKMLHLDDEFALINWLLEVASSSTRFTSVRSSENSSNSQVVSRSTNSQSSGYLRPVQVLSSNHQHLLTYRSKLCRSPFPGALAIKHLIFKMQLLPATSIYIRSMGRLLLLAILVIIAYNEPAMARVSKKFLKGFLIGAYMAKHHEPIVIHMEKSKHG